MIIFYLLFFLLAACEVRVCVKSHTEERTVSSGSSFGILYPQYGAMGSSQKKNVTVCDKWETVKPEKE